MTPLDELNDLEGRFIKRELVIEVIRHVARCIADGYSDRAMELLESLYVRLLQDDALSLQFEIRHGMTEGTCQMQ